MSVFSAIAHVLRWESGGDPAGGRTDDPNDPGGATRWGISSRAHPDVDLDRLEALDAAEIYFREYWRPTVELLKPIAGELELEDLAPLEFALFDFAVHSGIGRAVRELQGAAGVKQDGILGPATRRALVRLAIQNVALELCDRRSDYLYRATQRDPRLQGFRAGWLARVDAVRKRIRARSDVG